MLIDLATLTFESAKELAGTTFTVALPESRTTSMRLDDVQAYEVRQPKNSRMVAKRAPFSLFFSGDPAIVLPQGMYTLSSNAATLEHVFIVPLGRNDQATQYEAVFT